MVMDMLRSHMLSRARMIQGSDQVSTVRWYPCAPGAKAFPHWHAFGSPVWEDRNEEPDQFVGPGIFLAGAEWRGKRYPAPPGEHFHGLPEWFENGLPASELTEEPFETYGCRTAAVDIGGMALGGTAPFTYARVLVPRPVGFCMVSPLCFEDLGRQRPPALLTTGTRAGAAFDAHHVLHSALTTGTRTGALFGSYHVLHSALTTGTRAGAAFDVVFTPGFNPAFPAGSRVGVVFDVYKDVHLDLVPGSTVGAGFDVSSSP